jgi:hypothetical protein
VSLILFPTESRIVKKSINPPEFRQKGITMRKMEISKVLGVLGWVVAGVLAVYFLVFLINIKNMNKREFTITCRTATGETLVQRVYADSITFTSEKMVFLNDDGHPATTTMAEKEINIR